MMAQNKKSSFEEAREGELEVIAFSSGVHVDEEHPAYWLLAGAESFRDEPLQDPGHFK